MLLLVSRIDKGHLRLNRVHFTEVEDDLGNLITRFGGRSSAGGPKPEQPFFHLSSSPFWTVHLAEGQTPVLKKTPSLRLLRHANTLGAFPEQVFNLLRASSEARDAVATDLLSRSLSEDVAAKLRSFVACCSNQR